LNPPESLVKILREENNFLILTHTTPDGDAFGSALALKFLLDQLGKKSQVYTEIPVPSQYKFLSGIDYIRDLKELNIDGFNVLILVDCNNLRRISYDKNIIDKLHSFKGKILIIDHHIEDKSSFNSASKELVKWIDSEKAATGILIYYLIKSLEGRITKEIATNLYTAIIVDTGNFQFDNTTEEVLSIATELVRVGAKPSYIYQQCFESWSEKRFKLFTIMLNKLEILPPVAISFISKSDFQATETTESDTERFVEFLRILNNVNISALFREIEPSFIKVSLRSKGEIDVSLIARDFGGGGHKNAAGYRINDTFEGARMRLLERLTYYKLL